MSDEALKGDADPVEKPPLHLVAPEFIWGVARVLAHGAAKYGAWNWVKGKAWSRDYSAALRHMTLWAGGEDVAPDSGISHLLHAATCLMIVYVSQLRGVGTDDRHKWQHRDDSHHECKCSVKSPCNECVCGKKWPCSEIDDKETT